MMKYHALTTVLLLLACVSFIMQFIVKEPILFYCDIAAFALPTVAAIVEIVISKRSSKETEKQIKKLEDNQLSVRVENETLIFNQGDK